VESVRLIVLLISMPIIKEIVTIVLPIVQLVLAHHHVKVAQLEKGFTEEYVGLVLQRPILVVLTV